MSPGAAAPLLSASWFRVARQRPVLDPQARVERVAYRRQTWYVLVRADGRRSFRLNAAAYAFAARCDGRLDLQRLWELLLAEFKDDAPTQDELLGLLARLHEVGLLGFDRKPDFGLRGALQSAPGEADPTRRNSLLAFRVPLGHDDRWLDALAPRLALLFTRAALAAWLLLVLAGAVAAALNADMLLAYARTWLGTPRLLLMAWLAYPVVKALHELAHALVLKHFGGNISEWGLTLMVFTPVPYVDASAASLLPRAHQRLLVSAAGILLELGLAALALLFALEIESGMVRDMALTVFFIGSVSTLLVNANPLLRFDGYHMLSDALELPNLATRSARCWVLVLRRRLLAGDASGALSPAPGEAAWLWAYAPAALACRLALSVAIVLWLGDLSVVLGSAIALYFIVTMLLRPGWRVLRWAGGVMADDAQRRRVRTRLAVLVASAVAGFTLLPLPYASVAQGVVWASDDARVRAGTDGFIERVHVADGQAVSAGQLLFTLAAPTLDADRARLSGRVTALDTERFQALRRDPARAVGIEHELERAEAELARLDERQRQLEVRARTAGVIAIDHAADLPGRFARQGVVLAQLLVEGPTTVRVAVPQALAALVQGSTRGVSVRLDEAPGASWPAVREQGASGAVRRLPSAALGDAAGGSIVTDPADEDALTAAHAVVLTDVSIAHRKAVRLGARAWVRFDHGFAPLALQVGRLLQQLWV